MTLGAAEVVGGRVGRCRTEIDTIAAVRTSSKYQPVCWWARVGKAGRQFTIVTALDVNETGLFLFNELLLMTTLLFTDCLAGDCSSSVGDLPAAINLFCF